MKLDFTIDRLRRMAVFARVVEHRSMTGAARELGMSPSAVSQQIRQLEAETGTLLLHRSTRRVLPSEAGQAFYEGCAALLHAAHQADQTLAQLRDAPTGELRIATPVGFATRQLAPALAPLLQAHPGLSLRLFVEDRRIDLIGERIDLAIRIGTLPDSSLIARRLVEWPHALYATPDYLARHGTLQQPEDLAHHENLFLTALEAPEFIQLTHRDGDTRRVRLGGRVAANSAVALKQLMLAGLGIMRLPGPDAALEVQQGMVTRVLPAWSMAPIGVYAVTPQRDPQPAKVRLAIAALQARLHEDAVPA